MLRLAEGYRSAMQAEASWAVQSGMDFHLRGDSLQPGANATTGSDSIRGLIGPWSLHGPRKRLAGYTNQP